MPGRTRPCEPPEDSGIQADPGAGGRPLRGALCVVRASWRKTRNKGAVLFTLWAGAVLRRSAPTVTRLVTDPHGRRVEHLFDLAAF